MRTWTVLAALCGLLSVAHGACDLNGKQPDKEFPNIEKESIISYVMGVEYTALDATQTDYYTEYYDITWHRGRVDSQIGGDSFTYIYYSETWEAWDIRGRSCVLKNLTAVPEMFRSDQSDWTHVPDEDKGVRTIGPSAMFKVARQAWNKADRSKMAYMGETDAPVRGLKAHYWRLCKDGSYVDYFFGKGKTSAYEIEEVVEVPLRVVFGPDRTGEDKQLSQQEYEIISFQPYIKAESMPFQLPKGRGCRRGSEVDLPSIPDFAQGSLMFSAEVTYRLRDTSSGDDTKLWSYYSTISYALDRDSNHLVYTYSSWNSSKNTPEEEEPQTLPPKIVIFDLTHGYSYETDLGTGQCMISRKKNFSPKYTLPNDLGSIALDAPIILYPNAEFTYLSEGMNRGLRVDQWEARVENYPLDISEGGVSIPNITVTHSYLKDWETLDGVTSVKDALVQVQLRMYGRVGNKQFEEVTFNFFSFSTRLRDKRQMFNILSCFKNDDDFVYVTIGMDAARDDLPALKEHTPAIVSEFMGKLRDQTDLTEVRVPVVLVDVKETILITMLLLGKPPIDLDYEDGVRGKTIGGAVHKEGVSTFAECGRQCLEDESECWGFSMCGTTCFFGLTKSPKIENSEECTLWKRYDMKRYMVSKETVVQNLRGQVATNEFDLTIPAGDKQYLIRATSIQVTDPAEDDELFEKLGNKLNPRMRVYQAGFRLKENRAKEVKNLGKLRYDECQRLCLDFSDCETVSYCLMDSSCAISTKFADDLNDDEDLIEDNTCTVVTRKYGDLFERSPGIVLSVAATKELDYNTAEQCARACLLENTFTCLSFDHCPQAKSSACKLHRLHYADPTRQEGNTQKETNCGHYFRKFSTEFHRTAERRTVGSSLTPLTNLTLEECSKRCVELGGGECKGFDFCQDQTMFATSCVLMDKTDLKTVFSPICSNYLPKAPIQLSRPYSNSYAGGIGFLCFLIGGLVGAGVIFLIAYIRVNRR